MYGPIIYLHYWMYDEWNVTVDTNISADSFWNKFNSSIIGSLQHSQKQNLDINIIYFHITTYTSPM